MNIAVLCLLIAGLQPLLWAMVSKSGAMKAGISYDNNRPRETVAGYQGWHQRANWAQQNALEAFPLFAAAVLACLATGVDSATINLWAVFFVVVRFVYGFFYIADWATLRSLTWFLGMVAVVRLFLAAI